LTHADLLLALNPGSSSIKLAVYEADRLKPKRIGRGMIDLRRQPLILHITEGPQSSEIPLKAELDADLHGVVDETLAWLAKHFSFSTLAAIGHRVVHGGDRFLGPAVIDENTLEAINALTPLASERPPYSGDQTSAPTSSAGCLIRHRLSSQPK
jgi:acetate kinase